MFHFDSLGFLLNILCTAYMISYGFAAAFYLGLSWQWMLVFAIPFLLMSLFFGLCFMIVFGEIIEKIKK